MKTRNLIFAEHPLAYFRALTPTLERFFEEAPLPAPRRPTAAEAGWLPSVDVFARHGMLVLRADLPGMTKDGVKIEVRNNFITIEGERKSDFGEEKGGVYRMERAYGTFFRAVPLPEGVKPETVKATFNNGVLEVTAPLPMAATEPKARLVEIEEPALKASPAA